MAEHLRFVRGFRGKGQTGTINGTVVDTTTKTPVAGAAARGQFSILGLSVDTYTLSSEANGFRIAFLRRRH